jgi:hypothetical protein
MIPKVLQNTILELAAYGIFQSITGYNTSILPCVFILSPFPICTVMSKIEGREGNLIL